MAHNLNIVNGKASFVSANGIKPWHNLGQIVEGALTSEQCIELAGLNYEVDKTNVWANIDGKPHLVPDKFATFRKDTNDVFGIVGNRYEIIQNADAFTFFDAITGAKEAIYETAGALGKGEKVFITAKMPDYIRINGTDDVTEVYVILTSSHDGSGSIIAGITPIRIVCQNTLNAALRGLQNKVSIRHTSNAKQKLEQAHKLLGISHEYVNEVNQLFNHLSNVKVSDAQAKMVIEKVWDSQKEDSTRVNNIRDAVMMAYQSGVGQQGIVGTAWGLYNGITYFLDHVQNYKDQDVKFESILAGASASKANKALELITSL